MNIPSLKTKSVNSRNLLAAVIPAVNRVCPLRLKKWQSRFPALLNHEDSSYGNNNLYYIIARPVRLGKCLGGGVTSNFKKPQTGGFKTRPYAADKWMDRERTTKHGFLPLTDGLHKILKISWQILREFVKSYSVPRKGDWSAKDFWNQTRQLVVVGKHTEGGLPRAAITIWNETRPWAASGSAMAFLFSASS